MPPAMIQEPVQHRPLKPTARHKENHGSKSACHNLASFGSLVDSAAPYKVLALAFSVVSSTLTNTGENSPTKFRKTSPTGDSIPNKRTLTGTLFHQHHQHIFLQRIVPGLT